MKTLDAFQLDEHVTYREFGSHRQLAPRQLLEEIEADVLVAYDGYEAAVTNGPLQPLPLTDTQKKALRDNYRLTYPKGAMSTIRERIMVLAPQGRCPYCDSAQVGTLDHYLPKAMFAEFSVLCANLIPACYRCNHIRKDDLLDFDGTRLWHCYLDAVPADPILFAEVVPTQGTIATRFFLKNSAGLNDDEFRRYEFLFKALRLADFFVGEATATLYEDALALSRLWDAGGTPALQQHFKTTSQDVIARRGRNSWMGALYIAMSDVVDFAIPEFDELVRVT